MRINKYLALQQYASRREADTLVEQGKVFINGRKAVLGDQVEPDDVVDVRGAQSKKRVYYLYHKPRGVVTINAQEGEKEISDITSFPESVYPVGRLDKESEGLLLFTNDGRVADALLRPENHHEKEYAVEVHKPITHAFLTRMQHGVDIGAVGKTKHYITKPALVRCIKPHSFEIVLTEGKNRQIRRACAALGYEVKKLKRFRIQNLELGKLRKGEFRELNGDELVQFLTQLGL
ncbi:MAG: pseudouridine synthase [Patescibacteria group bacterium UBA2163]